MDKGIVYSKTNIPSLEIVLKAISGSYGIKEKICINIGCDRPTLDAAIKKYSTAKELMEVERQKKIDLAEQQLIDRISKGDIVAIKTLLNSIGKERGYGEIETSKKPTKPGEGAGWEYGNVQIYVDSKK